jgi:hypothetical protein
LSQRDGTILMIMRSRTYADFGSLTLRATVEVNVLRTRDPAPVTYNPPPF